MAEHPLEVAEITSTAQVLALNLGNITDARMEAMPIALKTAVQKEIPVLLDLVGTACSTLRKNFAKELLKIHVPSVLKGNMSELLAMIEEESHAVGIDAGEKDSITDENRNRLTKRFQEKANEWNTVFLITGKEDMIISKDECFFVQNGSPAMANITGTGCMLGMVCASYLASASNAFNLIPSSTYCIISVTISQAEDAYGSTYERTAPVIVSLERLWWSNTIVVLHLSRSDGHSVLCARFASTTMTTVDGLR